MGAQRSRRRRWAGKGAHWLEWQSWADPVLQQPWAVEGGELRIPVVPGVGLEWDEDAVAAHLV